MINSELTKRLRINERINKSINKKIGWRSAIQITVCASVTSVLIVASNHQTVSAQTGSFSTFSADDKRLSGDHHCPPNTLTVRNPDIDPATPLDDLPIELEADTVEAEGNDIVILRGRAEVIQGRQAISADELRYNRDTERLQAMGNVVIFTAAGDRLETTSLDVELSSLTGVAGETKFQLSNRSTPAKNPNQVIVRARGTAQSVALEGEDSVRMESVRYSTCVEGQDDVVVAARELRLDHATGTGTARGVSLRLGGVPALYLPYLTFPITDERKSGFLMPGIGTDEDSGFVLQAPYYWNIAPDKDATITPRILTDRGVQVAAEMRYLGEKHEGAVRGEYLPGDDLFGDDRSAVSFQHKQEFSEKLTGDLNFQWISDEFYLDDFENELQISSATHLPQRGELAYRGDSWNVTGRVFAYQTVDESIAEINRPHDRLPQILFNTSQLTPNGGLRYGLDGELVNFDRNAGLSGWRADLTPYVSMPMREVFGYVTPRVSVRHTTYSLDGTAADADDNPSRTVPIASVDSGLYFDRETTVGGNNYTHTLEPRLFFLYVPDEDQDDLPLFDTGLADLNNFSNIFRENRFFGADRVGDTQQVTVGVTTRLINDSTGNEYFKGSIGQAYFLDDREVSLTAGTVDRTDSSDFLGEFRLRPNQDLSFYGFTQYDSDDSEFKNFRFNVDYQPSARKRIAAGYIDQNDSLEQFDLNLRWPLSAKWDIGLDERYDLNDSRSVETTVRLGYDACCWSVDFAFQRRLERSEEQRNAFFMTLELTGLTRIRAGL